MTLGVMRKCLSMLCTVLQISQALLPKLFSATLVFVRKMHFEDLSKLRSPIRELVLSTSENGEILLGNDDNDRKEVMGWIEKLSQKDFVTESNLEVRYRLSVWPG